MMDILGARVVGPLEPYAAGFAEDLARLGYTSITCRQYMTLVAHLSRWLSREALDAAGLTADVAGCYVQARAVAGYHAFRSSRSLDVWLSYLRAVGAAPTEPPAALSAVDSVVERFRAHLLDERGLKPSVAEFYVASVRPFVSTVVVGDAIAAAGLSARAVTAEFPAEHWVHLRTSNPIESTFATVRHRTKVTKGPGSRAAGLAMAFKLIEAAQDRWRAVNAPHLVALVRAGATFINGQLVERPEEVTAA